MHSAQADQEHQNDEALCFESLDFPPHGPINGDIYTFTKDRISEHQIRVLKFYTTSFMISAQSK